MPSLEEKKEALQHLLNSREFENAPKLREFLRYVVTRALSGHRCHEAEIGRAVYVRPSDYTPAEDSIVRVEARNLRKKLETYFESEGKTEPVVISIPKGTYVPRFSRRKPARRSLKAALSRRISLGRASTLLVTLLLASLAGNVWFWTRHLSSRETAPATDASPSPHLPWTMLFNGDQETDVVVADSIFSLQQYFLGRKLSLADYLRPDLPATSGPADLTAGARQIAGEISYLQYTSFADARLVGKIMQLHEASGTKVNIRFARNMHARDFKGKNVILLGSVRSNPWCELFEPNLNFVFGFGDQAYIRNKSPRPGEQAIYRAGGSNGRSDKIYGVISLVRNLSDDGFVLMIAGTRMESTEAAGELLLNSDLATKMFQKLNLRANSRLRLFQVLLKSSRIEGTSKGIKLLAYRIVPD